METAVRWSPSSSIDEQRFLLVDVTGCSFRHCKVESYDGKNLRYATLSRNRRVPHFRAFDWSPHDESIVAVGEWSGSATVLRIDDEQASTITIPAKQQRVCNAISFAKSGLLAIGLERVRNDTCLNIWDVEHRLLTSASPVGSPGSSQHEPVRRFASSEGVTSIKFFHGQPDSLVAGIKGASIRLYDLRDNAGNAAIQFQTTSVHNISIDPVNENYFASAGTHKDTTIQIWDRRFGSPAPATPLGAGPVMNAHLGPVLEYRRAFEASSRVAPPSIWSLRYCRGRSGFLGALASNGDFKIFETREALANESNEHHEQGHWQQEWQSSIDQQLSTKRVHHVEPPSDTSKHGGRESGHIVAFDFTNLAGPKGMPTAIILRSNKSVEVHELKSLPPVLAMSATGQLIGSRINQQAVNKNSVTDDVFARAGLSSISTDRNEMSVNGKAHPTRSSGNSPPVGDNKNNMPQNPERFSSREEHERWVQAKQTKQSSGVGPLESGLTEIRRRCIQGYLFDCQKNRSIVADDPWLQTMWNWIGGKSALRREKQKLTQRTPEAKRLALDQSLEVRGIDLSYLGVCNIWNVDLGSEKATRISGRSDNTDILLYAIEAICRSLDLPEFTSIESSLPAHRRLCLHICALGLAGEDLDNAVQDLVGKERVTEAAFLALIHNEPKQALSALKAGSTPRNRELSLALAGFIRGTTDDTWDETIQDIASSVTDPFARAILAFVRTGAWQDVLSETSLPLKHRIGIALMYIADDALTTWITTTTDECITHGDIEGIVLTGLSEKAIPLFQTYILKYNDLQSAILALSHTSPRYFPSALVDAWRAEYRNRLNTHRLFLHRVRFDTGATALSASPSTSSSLPNNPNPTTNTNTNSNNSNNNNNTDAPPQQQPKLKPPPRQISLRCGHCEQALDRNPDHMAASAPPASYTAGGTGTGGSGIFVDHKSGTVCPKCGRHLPRCAVCMLWLGVPDPTRSKGGWWASENLKKRGPDPEEEEGNAGI
ncbi:MAG: hypothetical protein LQ350_007030 [Teloschistes chrysophthalmus]|nr:MAG: hypothetical protein LQ350_007030 [Niorma chrysophthalma]